MGLRWGDGPGDESDVEGGEKTGVVNLCGKPRHLVLLRVSEFAFYLPALPI